MKVSVDQDGCISCGLCVNLCPEVFEFNEDDVSVVKNQPSESQEETVADAADGCPVSVIHITK